MARHSKLNDAQKERVVELYDAHVKQINIAQYFNVSPRTINRILIEKGVLASPEMKEFNQTQILKLCAEHGLTADSLRKKLEQPELTIDTLRHVLGNLTPAHLGELVHSSIVQAMAHQQQQARAMPTEQEKLAL